MQRWAETHMEPKDKTGTCFCLLPPWSVHDQQEKMVPNATELLTLLAQDLEKVKKIWGNWKIVRARAAWESQQCSMDVCKLL